MSAIPYLVTLRIEVDESTGDQGVTLIIGGSHRGGMSEGRWGFAGGLTTDIARDIMQEVGSALGFYLSCSRDDGQGILI